MTNMNSEFENKSQKVPPFSLDQTGSAVNHSQYSAEIEHMEAELRLTLEEIARLQNALAEANMKNTALQAAIGNQPTKIDGNQLIKPVLQELRQPLHTIQGYLDLLSNESVGVLGTFQKRFLERISGSVELMDSLLSKLENETGENNEEARSYSKEFSLTIVIEETLAFFTEMIRNKLITLKVEFESEEIKFIGDQELFERVLNILFTNACASIQNEGTISLGLKTLRGKRPAQVMFSIQSCDHDSPKAKPLPVKLQEFKDPDTKLEGFGSVLKDLVKANSLVEELHGKMEIFSIPSTGSLVRVKLPITS
jgi:signal transduction histidine kinase